MADQMPEGYPADRPDMERRAAVHAAQHAMENWMIATATLAGAGAVCTDDEWAYLTDRVRWAAEYGTEQQKVLAPLMLALIDANRDTTYALVSQNPAWMAAVEAGRRRDAGQRGEN